METKDVFIKFEKERYDVKVDLKKAQFGTKDTWCVNK
jgi:hypothetical protein